MGLEIPRRLLVPAACGVVLAALAGCSASGSSVAVTGSASTAATASAVASTSAMASTSPQPSAAATTSATPSTAASTAPSPTPTPKALASTPRSAQDASALLDSALAAVQAQTSVHGVCNTPSSSGNSVNSWDVGVASGRGATTDGTVTITTELLDGVAYVTTNTAGVWVTEGISQAEAQKLVAAGDWLSIKPGQSYGNEYLNYPLAISGMTVPDLATVLRLTGSLTRTAETSVQGVPVYGVTGSMPSASGSGTETVYIAATGAPLPVSATSHSTSGTTTTCDYSGWGEPLNLTVPANVVPITAIPG